jgi:hypothetical protein
MFSSFIKFDSETMIEGFESQYHKLMELPNFSV